MKPHQKFLITAGLTLGGLLGLYNKAEAQDHFKLDDRRTEHIWVDADGDKDKDLIRREVHFDGDEYWKFYLSRNTGKLQKQEYMGIFGPEKEEKYQLIDYDGDGDLDILGTKTEQRPDNEILNKYTLYRNSNNKKFERGEIIGLTSGRSTYAPNN